MVKFECRCNIMRCRTPFGTIPKRIITAFMLHIGLQCSFNLRQSFNVAIYEISEPPPQENTTEIACPQFPEIVVYAKDTRYQWSRLHQATALRAFFYGNTVVQIPGGWYADHYGGKYIMFTSLFIGAVLNALMPLLMDKGGYMAAAVSRGLLGIFLGPVLPSLASFCSKWFPPSERPLLGGISYAGSNLGNILGSVVTGYLIKYTGSWSLTFYFWSAITGIYSILLLMYLYSSPSLHPYIDEDELDYLKKTIVVKKMLRTPWKAILLNVPVWANVWGQYGHNYTYFIMITYLPTYMLDILRFDSAQNGLFSAVPLISLWISSLFLCFYGHYLLRKIYFMSPLAFSRIFGTFGNYGCALFAVGATYVGCNVEWALTLYIIGMSIKALNYVTLTVNINELSRNYGGIIYGIANTVASTSGLVGTAVTGYVTRNKTLVQWQTAFWITFAVTVVSSIIYALWSSSDRQLFDYAEGDEPDSNIGIE